MSDFQGDCSDGSSTQPRKSKSYNEDINVVARLIPINPRVNASIIEISKSEITIGRNPDCSIVFNQTEISGTHCKIFLSQGHVVIQDLRYVNYSLPTINAYFDIYW